MTVELRPRFGALACALAVIAAPAAARAQPADASPPPGAVAPPVDWQAAPLPTEASGIAHPTDSGPRWPRAVGRAALFVPKWLVIIAASPVRLAAWSYERYQLRDRFKQVFFNYDGTFGVYPVALFETGFGLNVGARLVHKDLFGAGESVRLRAGFGGIFEQIYEAKLRTGDRLGRRLALELSARFERRGKDKFYGVGNADRVAAPGGALDAIDGGAVESGFRQDVLRGLLLGRLHVTEQLSARLSGAIVLRDLSDVDRPGEILSDNYDPATVIGFEQGVSSGYGELELRYDSRRRASVFQTRAVPAAGGLLAAFAGYQRGFGDDPSDFVRYGADAQWFVDLYNGSRVLGLRAYLEGVAATGSRIDQVPFVELPRLGGPQLLRGYDLDRFRDRVVALASAEYTYDLSIFVSAFAFVDAGRPYRELRDVGLSDLRVGYGGGLQLHSARSVLARVQPRSSIDGGVLFRLPLDPEFASRARAGR